MSKFFKVVLEAEKWPKWEVLADGTEHYEDNRNIKFTKDGELHRLNGPAHIDKRTQEQSWFINGKRHRIGGPAYISANREEWYLDGKLHRTDGPAVIDDRVSKVWYYINGNLLSKKEFDKHFGED